MQEDYDDDVAYQTYRKIYDLARSDNKKPFFGVVSFTSPHTPFNVSQRYWDLYDHNDIDLPTVPEIPFGTLDYLSKALFFAHGRHRHSVTNDHRLNARHAYYAMISYLDEKLGQLLDQLEETGLREDTVVVFTSDHGEMMGERGMWFKQCFWEWSARVPLVISDGRTNPHTRIQSNCSLIDLLPTFIDLAGGNETLLAPAMSELAGHSLVPLFSGKADQWKDCVIADYLAIGPCVPCRMVKKGPYKYIFTFRRPDLLFDLEADPNELINLAEDAAYLPILNELKGIGMNGYNPEMLMTKIVASQRRRSFIANLPGTKPNWDYVAFQGDGERYVRRDGVDATKSRLRLPRVATILPDLPPLSPERIDQMMRGEIDFGD
jgi:choline-sulfatase